MPIHRKHFHRKKKKSKKRGKKSKPKVNGKANGKGAQKSFFSLPAAGALPKRRDIQIADKFSSDDLRRLSTQIRLDEAAARRQMQELRGGAQRGGGHGDPRPADWAALDRKQFAFLGQQLSRVIYRGQNTIDTSALSATEMTDLWQFTRHEADRATRQIDHLNGPSSGIGGPSADYLTKQHKLKAGFYSHLTGQLEAVIPAEDIEAATAWENV